MSVFRKRELYDVVVLHQRAGKIPEEELRGWLEGQAEQGTVRGAMEIAERLIWTYWEQGRAGMPADEMVHKVDAIMEFQAQLMAFSEPRKKAGV